MKKLLLAILLFFLWPLAAEAQELNVYIFYSSTCPHCHAELEYLDSLDYEDVVIKKYEVTSSDANLDLMNMVKETFDSTKNYVPYTVIGENCLTGFNDNIQENIDYLIEKYRNQEYVDVVEYAINNNAPYIFSEEEEYKKEQEKEEENHNITVLGKEIDPTTFSLPLLAVIIGFLDGFNPCAMWVLIFLISMLMGTSRKKMLILGSVFLSASAIIYALFMVAWLNVMISAMGISIIKILIGVIAILGAIWNFKGYYDSIKKDVGCEVTNPTRRQKLVKKIKKFTGEKSLLLASLGMIALAFSINLIEFACSAGWPVIFTEVLALNNLSTFDYFICILIYIIFYLIDDLVIFIIAVVTLKITGISNKYNKYSHLIGGILMLIIGILMIVAPNILMLNF